MNITKVIMTNFKVILDDMYPCYELVIKARLHVYDTEMFIIPKVLLIELDQTFGKFHRGTTTLRGSHAGIRQRLRTRPRELRHDLAQSRKPKQVAGPLRHVPKGDGAPLSGRKSDGISGGSLCDSGGRVGGGTSPHDCHAIGHWLDARGAGLVSAQNGKRQQ